MTRSYLPNRQLYCVGWGKVPAHTIKSIYEMASIQTRNLTALLMALALSAMAACSAQPSVQSPTDPPTAPPASPTPQPSLAPEATLAEPTPAPEGALAYAAFGGGGPHLVWERDNLDAYQELNTDFEISFTTGDYYRSYVMRGVLPVLELDPPPDVVSSLMVGVLRESVEAGRIMDISDLWVENGWDEAFPASLKEWVTFDGRQYFVPLAIQWNGIYYRKSIFNEAGLMPPETWDELLAACDTLVEAGITPFTVSVSQWPPPAGFWFTAINLRLNGPDFHESLMRGEERYDDSRVLDVFAQIQEMFDHQCFADDSSRNTYQAGISDFSTGETAMYNHGEWLYEFIGEDIKADTGFFPYPVMAENIPNGELVPMFGAFIPAGAAHPVEARRFLTYLAGEQSQRSSFEALGRVASHLGVERELYDEVHRQGLELVEGAGALTQLMGFNTHPDVAQEGYNVITRFWSNPAIIEEIIGDWEQARAEIYGELPE